MVDGPSYLARSNLGRPHVLRANPHANDVREHGPKWWKRAEHPDRKRHVSRSVRSRELGPDHHLLHRHL